LARIVLDTDVVSLYRMGRLPADFARHVAANDLSIAFATAGELWKWALGRRLLHRGRAPAADPQPPRLRRLRRARQVMLLG
jgi:hypothetical protein